MILRITQTPASVNLQTRNLAPCPPRAESKAALLLLLLVPVDGLVAAALVSAEVIARIRRWAAPKDIPGFRPPRPECSFVMLNWNSQAALEQSLAKLFAEVRKEGAKHEIIVVDNHSTDSSEEFVRRRFPQVRLITNRENLYFGAGIRVGIAAATRDILVLMNNDTVVHSGFLRPLLKAFFDPTVFGVASQVSCCGGSTPETGNTCARFNGCDMEWTHTSVPQESSNCPVSWLHRGLFAVDRRKYLWLGGLDAVYDPFYMEDVDLSHRAWKVGWRCLLVTDSRVTHSHSLSTPAAGLGFLHMIIRRNQYIFFWKNISDLSMLLKYCLCATGRRMRRANMPNIGVLGEMHSYFAAVKRLPWILLRRVAYARPIVRTDRELYCEAEKP